MIVSARPAAASATDTLHPDDPPGAALTDTIFIRTAREAEAPLDATAFHREWELVIEAATPGLAAGDLEVGYEETALPVVEIGPEAGSLLGAYYFNDPERIAFHEEPEGARISIELKSSTGNQEYDDYALYGLRASGPWMEVRVATSGYGRVRPHGLRIAGVGRARRSPIVTPPRVEPEAPPRRARTPDRHGARPADELPVLAAPQ